MTNRAEMGKSTLCCIWECNSRSNEVMRMIKRFLVFSSIAVFALAACSGGQPPRTNEEPETEPVAPEPEPEVEPSLVWAAMEPPTGPFIAQPAAVPASIRRTPRAAADDVHGTGTEDSDRLQVVRTAVRYEDGKSLFVPGASAATEEFPVNSITIRMGLSLDLEPSGDLEYIQGDDGTPADPTVGGLTTGLHFSDGVLDYSLQPTANGLVYKMRGNAAYFDFQRRFDIGENFLSWYSTGPDGIAGTPDDGLNTFANFVGADGTPGTADDRSDAGLDDHPNPWKQRAGCYSDLKDATADCINWNFDDVQVTFGLPAAAPNTYPAWYWNVRVPFRDGASSLDRNLADQFDYTYSSNRDLGSYEMWLTTLGRIDPNLEDSGAQPYTRDDANRYLSYAAYGLFVFTDNLGSFQTVDRAQALHFGYEAFADSDDARTTDISSAVTATFTGKTMAHRYLHLAGGDSRRSHREELIADITLNAQIGGSGGGGITGIISNFRAIGSDRTWHRHFAIVDPDKVGEDDEVRLVLAGAAYKNEAAAPDGDTAGPKVFNRVDYKDYPAKINADGTYKGGVFLQEKVVDPSGTRWRDKTDAFDTTVTTGYNDDDDGTAQPGTSQFGGRFYGPTNNGLKDLETAGHWFLKGDAGCRSYGTGCSRALERTGGVYGSFGAFNAEKEFDQE